MRWAESLKFLLYGIREELLIKEKIREEVQRNMRKATRLSKQAILFIHQEKFEDAKELLKEARGLFTKLHKVSKDHSNLVHTGLVHAAFEEYAEANVLLNLILEKRFITPEELGVPSVSYVLGLADVIGELRRKSLDSLRKGEVELAGAYLQTMEHIYLELLSMEDAYLLISGLRRKCDIARRIIEITRGDVTNEARRSSLKNSIKELKTILGGKKEVGKA